MASVFWDSGEVIDVNFHPHYITVNAQYYSNLLHTDVHQAVQGKKETWELSTEAQMHDSACSDMADWQQGATLPTALT